MISIVVIVDDTNDNLENCVSNILMQSYSDFEIIFVVNESNKSLLSTLKKFEEKNNRIKIIVNTLSQKTNISKNIALNHVQGEYILFLDSNLELNENLFEEFIEKSKKDNLDILILDNDVNFEMETKFFKHYNTVLNNFEIDERFLFEFLSHDYTLFYKNSFLKENNIKFLDDKIFKGRDLFFLKCIFSSNRLFFMGNPNSDKINLNSHNCGINLNSDVFNELINLLLSNKITYNNFKNEFWTFIFENIFKLINGLGNGDVKSSYFKKAKELFESCCHDKKCHGDIYNSLDGLTLEFYKQSLDEVYYFPKKRNITQILANDDFNGLTIAIKSPHPVGDQTWGDYFFAEALKKAFEKRGFKVVVHEFERWYSENDNADIVIVLRGLKEYNPNAEHINIMWNISHPEAISVEEYDSYDLVFISSVKYAEIMDEKLMTTVKPLLQCTDPDVFYPEFNNNYSEDILFVGQTRSVFREIIKDISATSHDFSVYGGGWERYIDKKFIKGEFIANDVLNQYYSSCKILLNDHWEEMRKFDFPSNRLFDALACGAFIISDNIESARTLFENNVVIYNTVDDLNEKIDFYLNNDLERYKMKEAGKKIVLAKHTFDNRVDEIIEALKNLAFM